MIASLASLVAGTVLSQETFTGFSNDIVFIAGSAMAVDAAVARAEAMEAVPGWVPRRATRTGR